VRFALDIETKCGLACKEKCEHALDPFRNEITVIGVYSPDEARTFRSLQAFTDWLLGVPGCSFVGHNLKWDAKSLLAKGIDIRPYWADDSLLMAVAMPEKIPEAWLFSYEEARREANRALPRGFSHREGSQHSLKTLAPYFLGVEPFWENPCNHDSDEYVLADCRYTYELAGALEVRLQEQDAYEFYREKLFPWAQMLLEMESRGIALDMAALEQAEAQARADAAEAKRKLDVLWAPAYDEWRRQRQAELDANYATKSHAAIQKLKNPSDEKRGATVKRYIALADRAIEKIEPLNLDSPAQLTWLLRDFLALDIKDFDGEETTGKAVLQRLSGIGRDDVAEFLRYRKAQKLSQAFFPSYREMAVDGAIHCSFNPDIARTGRLSSSRPNLQQVERGIHHLFVARPGHKLATYDMSAIEPRLIAYYTEDPNLYSIVSQGLDFHGYNTKIFFELDCDVADIKKLFPKEREVGKEVALALMYGAGTNRLQESAQKRGFVWSKKECQAKLARFKEFYAAVYRYREREINPHLIAGGTIANILGRPYRIPNPENVHMQGFNTLIQGGASDLVLNSAQRIMTRFSEHGIDGHVLLLVHDEIVTEIPEARESECVSLIEDAMTSYELPTSLGPVKLAVEGKVASAWEK
jgi:DNA polymerase I-like protein with 3'-5' exonuclease and polymerase domains